MLITLTSDFGLHDPFVGIMKGVIFGINPQAAVIDLTHGVPPQDIMAGALTVRQASTYFPRGTIHVVIVDPGVGSGRRPLLIECDGSYFIGPDNGVLSLAIGDSKPAHIVALSNPAYHLKPTSATFHGRDIFAPAAARVSLGVTPVELGERLETFVRLALPKPLLKPDEIIGEIIYIDHFGNLYTNIGEHDLRGMTEAQPEIVLGAVNISGLAANYAAGLPNNFIAVVNSWGLLEIAVYRGNAAQASGAKIGDAVKLKGMASSFGG